MRIAWSEEELEAAILSSKRESKASFGDDRVLIEKYLARPRHIEIQVTLIRNLPSSSYHTIEAYFSIRSLQIRMETAFTCLSVIAQSKEDIRRCLKKPQR